MPKPASISPDEQTSKAPDWAVIETCNGRAITPHWFARDVARQLVDASEAARDASLFISKFLRKR